MSSAEPDVTPIMPEEIQRLPRWGAVALAARGAMRAQPFLTDECLADWGDLAGERLESIEMGAICAAVSAIQTERHEALSAVRDAVRASADPRNPAGRASRYAVQSVAAGDDSRPKEVYAAITSIKELDLQRDVHAANRGDYDELVNFARANSVEKSNRSVDQEAGPTTETPEQIAASFFQRKLWNVQANSPLAKRFSNAMHSLRSKGFPEYADRHMEMRRGDSFDFNDVVARLQSWVGREPGRAMLPRQFTPAIDEPALEDKLGREDLVETLAAMFASPDQKTPLTVALIGDWGAGKTSVMKQIEHRLKHEPEYKGRFAFAKFDVWEYEHTDNLRAGLAHEVLRGLTRELGWWEKRWFSFQFAQREHAGRMGCGLLSLFAAIATAGLSAWGLTKTPEGWQQGGIFGATGVALITFGAFAYRNLKPIVTHPIVSELASYIKLPSFNQHLGLIPVMKHQLKALTDLRLTSKRNTPERLVVFVDDLDRCGPEGIVTTLEAIRLVIDLENVIVVIGADSRVVLRAIAAYYAKHYEKLGEAEDGLKVPYRRPHRLARDYLGKIIQLPIRLSRCTELGDYVNAMFTVDEPKDDRAATNGGMIAGETGASPGEGSDGPPDTGKKGSIEGSPGKVPQTERTQPVSEPMTGIAKDTKEERRVFAEVTAKFQFSNPRQLKRLRNAYRLLRELDRRAEVRKPRQSPYGLQRIQRNMTMLFWLEFIYELNQDQALNASDLLKARKIDKTTDDPLAHIRDKVDELVGFVRERFGISETGQHTVAYEALEANVQRLILPHYNESTTQS